MDGSHFDALTRWWRGEQSRRNALARGVAALTAASLTPLLQDVEARKRRKKKRKKKKPPRSCAELCGSSCSFCFFRADAPALCGGGGGTICTSCRSDNDCVGEDAGGERRSYCVSRTGVHATGETKNTCGPGAACACDPGALGVCYQVDACGA